MACRPLQQQRRWLLLLLLLCWGGNGGALARKPQASAPSSTGPRSAAAAASQPLLDDEDVLPAPVHAFLEQDNSRSSRGGLRLVASVGENTAATAHSVSAILYEELTNRLHRLQQPQQQQQEDEDKRVAATIVQLRNAMARLSLLQQPQRIQQHGEAQEEQRQQNQRHEPLQQQERQEQPQQHQQDGDGHEGQSTGTSQADAAGGSPSQQQQLLGERQEQLQQLAKNRERLEEVLQKEGVFLQQQHAREKQQQDRVFLRKYLADSTGLKSEAENKSKRKPVHRHFAGIRASRNQTSSTSSLGVLPEVRVRRDVQAALSQALTAARFSVSRWRRQTTLMQGKGDTAKRGYVLADSCVAVDFRKILRRTAAAAPAETVAATPQQEETAAPSSTSSAAGDTAGSSKPHNVTPSPAAETAAVAGRYDKATGSCTCPSGWKPCSKDEALRVSYGWRKALERACAEEREEQMQQQPQQQDQQLQQLLVRAYAKDLHSFGCGGIEISAREAGDGETACAAAALVLCREVTPHCGVSEWSEWSTCSAPCGEGQAYRWRRPLLRVGRETDEVSPLELFRSCMPYHLEERKQCSVRKECPQFVNPEPCFWVLADPDELSNVHSKGSCVCATKNSGDEGKTPSLVPLEKPLVACSAVEAAYSFSRWRQQMLHYCFDALKLANKPRKAIKYSRRAADTRVALGSLGYIDCSGGWGVFERSSMVSFCEQGGPMLCRRSSHEGAAVPFAVDGYRELHISALQQSFAALQPSEKVEGLDGSWLAFLLGASLAALLLLFAFAHKRKLSVLFRARIRPAVSGPKRDKWERWVRTAAPLAQRAGAAVRHWIYTAQQRLARVVASLCRRYGIFPAAHTYSSTWSLFQAPVVQLQHARASTKTE